MNRVLVHTCFNPELQRQIFFPLKMTTKIIFVESPNAMCSCATRISFRDRDSRLASEEIVVLVRDSIPEWREVAERNKQTRVPAARSISNRDIERAYVGIVGDRPGAMDREARRIEVYGAMTQEMYGALGAELREARP